MNWQLRCRRYRDFHFQTDLGNHRRRAIARWRILELLREKLVSRTLASDSASERLDRLADEVARRQRDPYSAVEELIESSQIVSGQQSVRSGTDMTTDN